MQLYGWRTEMVFDFKKIISFVVPLKVVRKQVIMIIVTNASLFC